jgi:hypothetical protein
MRSASQVNSSFSHLMIRFNYLPLLAAPGPMRGMAFTSTVESKSLSSGAFGRPVHFWVVYWKCPASITSAMAVNFSICRSDSTLSTHEVVVPDSLVQTDARSMKASAWMAFPPVAFSEMPSPLRSELLVVCPLGGPS